MALLSPKGINTILFLNYGKNSKVIILNIFCSRAIMGYLVNAYAKDDSLYPSGAKERAAIDQVLYFDMGTLYQRYGECYVSWRINL